jgi:uncharacterized protein YpmB
MHHIVVYVMSESQTTDDGTEATVITLTDEQLASIQDDGVATIRLQSGDVVVVGKDQHQDAIVDVVGDADADVTQVPIAERDA